MPKEKYVPKHRNAPVRPVRSGARNVVVVSGVAVAATGVAVSAGVLANGSSPLQGDRLTLAAGAQQTEPLSPEDLADRQQRASRSSGDRRVEASPVKAAALSSGSGVAETHSEDLSTADPRTLSRALMPDYGISASEFGCLDELWTSESGWSVHATNPSSGAYGIPQALPGSKMASAGSDWRDSAETQIRWGLGYIEARYGGACSAWSFKQTHGWY